jgi:signal transduction histidine kinase
VEELQLMAEDKQALTKSHFTIQFASKGECTQVSVDEKLLRQMLVNLLSNAIKYSHSRGIVHFDLACEPSQVIFRIRDEGIGIPPEDRQHLFESFHRASNVGTLPGTGLGLAIVKKCVDLHGGQISVESEVGVGTTFCVMLPLNGNAVL